jgi:hypothetical protein
MARVLPITLLLLSCAAGIVAADSNSTAYLALCRIELLNGEAVDGFVHIGTAYGPKFYYWETNGVLVIDDKGRMTRLSFIAYDALGLERNSILELGKLRSGYWDTYFAPSSYGWQDDYEIYFMKDVSLRDGESRIQECSVTRDTLNGEKELAYQYTENVTDHYILLDYFPIFIEMPEAFEEGRFKGGKSKDIEFGDIQEFRLRFFESVSNGIEVIKRDFDYEQQPDAESNHMRFILVFDQESLFLDRHFKPSWVYDEKWKQQ